MIKIVIAEKQQWLIEAIKHFLLNQLDIEVVGEACNAKDLTNAVLLGQPQLILADIQLLEFDEMESIKIIKQFPQSKIIVFSMFEQLPSVKQLMTVGVSGYINKKSTFEEVLEAIRAVANQKTVFFGEIIFKDFPDKKEMFLSNRQKQVLHLVGQGNTSKEIAEILRIEKNTVDTHRKNIIAKMGIRGKKELTHFAIEQKYSLRGGGCQKYPININ